MLQLNRAWCILMAPWYCVFGKVILLWEYTRFTLCKNMAFFIPMTNSTITVLLEFSYLSHVNVTIHSAFMSLRGADRVSSWEVGGAGWVSSREVGRAGWVSAWEVGWGWVSVTRWDQRAPTTWLRLLVKECWYFCLFWQTWRFCSRWMFHIFAYRRLCYWDNVIWLKK